MYPFKRASGLLVQSDKIIALSEYIDENGEKCPNKTVVHTAAGKFIVDGKTWELMKEIEFEFDEGARNRAESRGKQTSTHNS
jgi:hypothetical protein